MEYQTSIVENMLRNYYSLQDHTDTEFTDMYVDLMMGLKALFKQNKTLYDTIVNVFVLGYPIVQYVKMSGTSKRQVHYNLDRGLTLLTNIMNGDKDAG
jgi:hypothetical protein